MGERFVSKAWGIPYSRADADSYVRWIMDNGAVFISGDGMLGAIKTPLPFNQTWIVAAELFWWSEGRNGLRLFDAFEAWAADADQITVSAIEHFPDSVRRFFGRRGYVSRETAWVRNG